MNLKNKKKTRVIFTSALLIVILGILILSRTVNKTALPLPEIGLLKIDGHTLTIHPSKKYLSYQKENIKNEQLLYCLNTEENPVTCNWQSSAEFQIEYNRNYFAYIKSPSINFISAPEPINYSIPNYIDSADLPEE